jgi:hypothetical protein
VIELGDQHTATCRERAERLVRAAAWAVKSGKAATAATVATPTRWDVDM